MEYNKNPIIAPFVINGLVLWARVDTPYYLERASQFEQFLMMSDDYAFFTPIKFEKL